MGNEQQPNYIKSRRYDIYPINGALALLKLKHNLNGLRKSNQPHQKER